MVARHFHDVFFNGKSLADFGVHVSGTEVFKGPEMDFTNVEVPGRNGDLHIFNNRFKNVNLNYKAFIAGGVLPHYARSVEKHPVTDYPYIQMIRDENSSFDMENEFMANARSLRQWLLSCKGYCRLEDTYHPDEYRLAAYKGPFDPDVILLKAGEFDLTFDCKPQRFLKSGDFAVVFTQGGWLLNPSFFVAEPIVRAYGKGDITIGDTIITISSDYPYSYMNIDCEIQDAYYKDGTNVINCNKYINLVDGDFFKLQPFENTVLLGSGITRLEIIPRWWIV